MAKTVIEAFETFMKDRINIDPEQSKSAKKSRDWLTEQILLLPNKYDDFPPIYEEVNIFYGSFERKTKKRPLDDIDIMICLKALGSTYVEDSGRIEITVPDSASPLRKLCNDGTDKLNSRKVINKFIDKLNQIEQYKKSEIHRNNEALTLELSSYDWNFDIVPCFFTTPAADGRTYYIMPDGNGDWQKTAPRLDRDRVQIINSKHSGNVLKVVRIIKYWNNRPTMPSIPSYLLENMILDYYDNNSFTASSFVDLESKNIFYDLITRVTSIVNDPKKIQGNLNNLTYLDRYKITQRAKSDFVKAYEAMELEKSKSYKESINKWGEVFGDKFPEYT